MQLEVHSKDAIGWRLNEATFGHVDLVLREARRRLLEESADEVEGHRFSLQFLRRRHAVLAEVYSVTASFTSPVLVQETTCS